MRVRIFLDRRLYPSLCQQKTTDGVQALSIHNDEDRVLANLDRLPPYPEAFGARHRAGTNRKPSHPFEETVGKETFPRPLWASYCGYGDLSPETVTFLFLMLAKMSMAFLWSSN